MTTRLEKRRGVISREAVRLAFKMGQRVEQLLLEKATELAIQQNSPGTTIEVTGAHLTAAISHCLPTDLRTQLGVLEDGQGLKL